MACPAVPTFAELHLIEASTWGTVPATPDGYKIEIANWSTNSSRNLVDNPTLRGRRDAARPLRGNLSVSGSFDHPLNLSSVGWLLKHVIGAPTTTGTGPYVHEFNVDPSNPIPSAGLVWELEHTDVTVFRKYAGVKLDTFGINFETEGPVICSIGWAGKTIEDPAGATIITGGGTLTEYDTEDVVDHFTCALEIPDTTSIAIVTALNFTFSNNHITNLYTIGGQGEVGCLPEDRATLTGTATVFFEDSTLLQAAIDNSESSIHATWTQGTSSLEITIPEIIWEVSDPQVGGQGTPITLDLPFTAFVDDSTEDSIIEVILTNGVASY